MKKVLVTGGAGFIASHIIDSYLEENYDVVVVDNFSTGNKKNLTKDVKIYNEDIRNKDAIFDIFKKEKPNIVNHHAAQINVRESLKNPINDAEINIFGSLNVLESAKNFGVEKFIFASTGGAIYGETENIPTSEMEKEFPLSPYGVTKLSFEKYLHFFATIYGFQYVVLRYSNVYGPRQNAKGEAGVVSIFITRILQGLIPNLNGNGEQTRDYIFVEDVAKMNMLASKCDFSGIFNIATERETSVLELFSLIESVLGKKIKKTHSEEIKGELMRSCLDTSLAKKKFSWEPKVNMKDGIKKTIDFFKNV